MARSYKDFDRPYRRGLVLGLSLAELFLILLFLLLLASIGMIEESSKTAAILRRALRHCPPLPHLP